MTLETQNFEKEQTKIPQQEKQQDKLKSINDTLQQFSIDKKDAQKQVEKIGKELDFKIPNNLDMGEKSLKEKIYSLFAPLKENLHKVIKKFLASEKKSIENSYASGGNSADNLDKVASGGNTADNIGNGENVIPEKNSIKNPSASGGNSADNLDKVASGGNTADNIGNGKNVV